MLIVLVIFIFLLLLSVLVLIHEWGHYITAKKLGIKVEEFGFGFPPKVWSIKRGETEYSINLLPIGGFVKLYGEDDAGGGKITLANKVSGAGSNVDIHRAFFARPAWQRALVVVAGVIMNTILAVGIYYVFLGMSNFRAELPLLSDHKFFMVNQVDRLDLIIGEIEKDSPASVAGVKPNSRVLSVNGEVIRSDEQFVRLVNDSKGKEMMMELEDIQTKETSTVTLIPRVNPPKNQGALGVRFSGIRIAELNYDTPVQRGLSGFIHPANLMAYNLSIMGQLVSVSVKEKTAAPISQGVSGPIGIASLVNLIIQIPDMKERVLQVLNLAGILSISLAFFNVLPIPALDGGRLFFILIEMVTRRKVSPKFENYAHAIGFAVLMGLIVLVTFNDIAKLIPGFGK